MFGHLRDFVRQRLEKTEKVWPSNLTMQHVRCFPLRHLRHFVASRHASTASASQGKGYARIRQDYEDFYTRRMYYRIHVRSACTTSPLSLMSTLHALVAVPSVSP